MRRDPDDQKEPATGIPGEKRSQEEGTAGAQILGHGEFRGLKEQAGNKAGPRTAREVDSRVVDSWAAATSFRLCSVAIWP